MNNSLKQVFDAEEFRKNGHMIIDLLADKLTLSHESRSEVIHFRDPDEEKDYWKNYRYKSIPEFLRDFLRSCTDLHNPKYMGHQVAVPAPLASLMGLVSDHLNNGMGVYEMGMAATAIESLLIDLFCNKIGYSSDSDGFLSSGGTLANLTALLTARNSVLSTKPQAKLVILVSDQAHFCIERAAMTMGLKTDQVVKISTDPLFRMDHNALKIAHQEQTNLGNTILAIVGCACTTATGSYDDLNFLADYCRKHQIWFHVDGAHGGPVIFSKKYKSLVDGLNEADSVVIDLHKMMMIPALATAVLFKRANDSYKGFQQEAKYLFNEEDKEWFTLAKRTYETTKYMMSLKLYITLQEYGEEHIETYIDRQYDLTRAFYKTLLAHQSFECPHDPMSNILCFRYINESKTEEELNLINKKIREDILSSGEFYIVQTVLKDKQYLRTTLMNPFSSEKHLNELVQKICQSTSP